MVVALWLFACVPMHAQTPPVAARPGEASVRFTVFALSGIEGLAYAPKPGQARATLRFYSAYRSPAYIYRGAARLCFYETTSASGVESPPVAVYDIPEGSADLLLIFFPRTSPAADGRKYEVFGVDDGLARTPRGHFSTLNVSGREYAAQYGSTRITIPVGVGPAHPAGGRVLLRLAARDEGRWIPVGKHDFHLTARDRILLVFYPPDEGGGFYPIIRRLSDELPRERGGAFGAASEDQG